VNVPPDHANATAMLVSATRASAKIPLVQQGDASPPAADYLWRALARPASTPKRRSNNLSGYPKGHGITREPVIDVIVAYTQKAAGNYLT
jgi:hypothetical protein